MQAVRPTVILNEALVVAVAHLVDDHQSPRDPSHSALSELMRASGLDQLDPLEKAGKEKRVRAILSRSLERGLDEAAAQFVTRLIDTIRGFGAFRPGSTNYVGSEPIENVRQLLRSEGLEFTSDGELLPIVLESLEGPHVDEVLAAYVRRARRGVLDAALVVGTGKDLLEAVAGFVLIKRYGTYPSTANFPTLLGQAFVVLGMATSSTDCGPNPTPIEKLERSLFDSACAVNSLRNKQATGNGRPFPSNVSDVEARAAVTTMGLIGELLLARA